MSQKKKKSKFAEKIEKLRKSVIFQAVLLGAFTLVASTMLSTSDLETRDAIKLRAEEDLKASIEQVVSLDLHDNDLLKSIMYLAGEDEELTTVYQATKGGVVTALAFTVSSYGYGGKITAIMALDAVGKVLGVRVLSHTETPGLGDKIEIQKDDWVLSFNGLSLGMPSEDKWAVKKDGGRFDEFSGATITPRAVVKAVKSGLMFFARHKEKLLTPLRAKKEEAAK
ncbi:MAG: electron transport complex subunit RsxG [Emcibacter sp.]|nr:electron transport complex subunit RsxG [Emcibacter sp.]